MQDNSYITIQSWMITQLELRGNDLLVYAIIYSFSQDGESKFRGSLSYLAEWCGCTRQGVQKNLKHLLERDLIEKTEVKRNNVLFNEYSCRVVNIVAEGGKQSCYNKIVDIKEEKKRISINRNTTPLMKKNLFQRCSDMIKLHGYSAKVEKTLREYLSLRLKMTDKPIYGEKQWDAILKKLEKLAPEDDKTQIKIIEQSIERGYASVFPVSDTRATRRKKTCDKDVSCEQYSEEEKDEIRKWQKGVVESGGRIKF